MRRGKEDEEREEEGKKRGRGDKEDEGKKIGG